MRYSKLLAALCSRSPIKQFQLATSSPVGFKFSNKCYIPNRFSSLNVHGVGGQHDAQLDTTSGIPAKEITSDNCVHATLLPSIEDVSLSAVNELTLSSWKSNVVKLTEDEILNFIDSSNRVAVLNDPLQSFISHLENECIHRASKWDTDEFMNFYKRYHQIGFIKHSNFTTYALRSRCTHILNRCTLSVILDFLTLVCASISDRQTRFNKCDVEHVLDEHLDVLQPHQVALFIHLLSSCGKTLRNDRLKKNLCLWFINQAETLPEDVVRRFMLLFAGHEPKNPLFITPWLVRVLKTIENRVQEFDLKCLSAIALACSRKIIFDEIILKKIASKLLDSLPHANLDHVQSVVESLVSLNYQSRTRDVYSELVQEMCQQPLLGALRDKPRILCRILAQLSFVDVYPYHLLSLNFSKECLQRGYKTLSKYNVPYEIRVLIGGIRIERPEYKGRKIGFNIIRYHTRKRRLSFRKTFQDCVPIETRAENTDDRLPNVPRQLSPYNRVLYSARSLLNHVFGSDEYTHACFVLPHSSRANILFATNKFKEPQKLPPTVRSNVMLSHNDLVSNDLEYYVIVFKSKNIYMDYEPIFMGEEIAKTRQLQNVGLKTIALVQHGWFKVGLRQTISTLRRTLLQEGIVLSRA